LLDFVVFVCESDLRKDREKKQDKMCHKTVYGLHVTVCAWSVSVWVGPT
jgi:hypothetical protein